MAREATERLDRLLVDRGLAATRAKAQALILAGRVRSCQERLDKPGQRVRRDLPLEVIGGRRWVSRAGEKLHGALAAFEVDPRGLDVLDVGASTGGFTQVLLEAGARRVAALDVGRGQLDWGLRTDERVVVVEGFNARYLESSDLPFRPQLATIDVSFISLDLVIPPVARCLTEGAGIVTLVKPQFEVGRRQVGRGGLVRDPRLHREALSRIVRLALGAGWGVAGVCSSPVRGATGNREFFLHLRPDGPGLPAAEVERRLDAVTGEDEREERT